MGQALIRAKLLDPRGFVTLRVRVEESRRTCRGCKREFVATPGQIPRVRRCVCGRVNRVPAVTLRDDEPPPKPEEPPATSRYVGRYRVVSRLGDGGMGSIFRVVDPEGQPLALKRLHSRASRSARERFRREAEILHRLSHPHVVKVFELNLDENSRPYFTMELVEGSTLHQLKGRLEPEVFVNIVAKAAEGLHHAHEHGLVHRDVKPHNIVVARGGEPKVVDFGLAHDVTANTLTQQGDLLGTPLYMAPEQMRGEHDRVDRRADVYSLGALLYEGLCGRLPFVAASLVELKEVIERGTIPPPSSLNPSISPALEAVVMRALSQDPDDRQDTGLTLSLELRRALRRPHDAPPPRRTPGRLRWVALIVGLFGVLSLSLAGALFVRRQAALDKRAKAERAARDDLERARAELAELEGLQPHEDAVSRARAARALVAGVLDPALLEQLEAADDELEQAARALAGEARNALAGVLASGPFEERDEARALLRESLDEDAEQPLVWRALARLELVDGRVSRVRAAAHEVTKRDPQDGLAQYLLGRALVSLGEPGPGIAALERALSGHLDGVSRVDVLAILGLAHLAREDLPEALSAARDARQSGGESGALTVLEVDLALRDEGDEPLACRLLEGLAAGDSDEPLVWQAVVQYLVQAEDWEGAERWLDARLEQDENPRLLALRAGLCRLRDEWDAADALYARALERVPLGEPLQERLVFERARLRHVQGRIDEGIELLQGTLDQGLAASQSLSYQLANLLLARNGPQDAERAQQLMAQWIGVPEDDRLVFEWRLALARGDLESAERVRRRTLSELAEHPYVLMLEARYLAALGRGDQFGVLLERARKRFPRVFGVRVSPAISYRTFFLTGLERLQRGCLSLRRARARGSADELARAGRHFEAAARLVPELTCASLLAAEVAAEAGAPPQEVLAALARLERPELLLVGMPEFPPAPQVLEELRGRQHLRSNAPQEAIAAFTRALEFSVPSDPGRRARRARLLTERAEAHEANGAPEAALEDLDQALELDPLLEEARVRRQQTRSSLNDAAGAEEDATALAALRAGPREEVAAALAALAGAEDAAAAAAPLEALRELQLVMRPELHLDLFLEVCRARGEALLRWSGPGAAFDDLAAYSQYAPRGLEVFYALEGQRFTSAQDRAAILQAVRTPTELPQLSASYRVGLSGWLLTEFARLEGKGADRALWSYLLAGEDGPSGPLAASALHLALGYPARARGHLAPVFEAPDPPPFAHYLRARLLALAGQENAALESLALAWDGGFQPPRGYGEDPYFEALRGRPEFARYLR